MKTQIINLSSPLWQHFLSQLRHDVFHLPAYLALEAARIGATPQAFFGRTGKPEIFCSLFASLLQ
ncbi:MAG: hypothetical protein LRZ84_22920 [Desertifilum sp.]|nr:hypothetical protein [Desertifilum sp.]